MRVKASTQRLKWWRRGAAKSCLVAALIPLIIVFVVIFVSGDSDPVEVCSTASLHSNEQIAYCPDEDDYLRRWVQKRFPSGQKRALKIVNVGLNKGYTIASVLAAVGVGDTSRESVVRAVLSHRIEALRNAGMNDSEVIANVVIPGLCGGCCDCGHLVPFSTLTEGGADANHTAPEPASDDVDIEVDYFGFEPAHANFNFLQQYWGKWQPPNPRHKVRLELIHAAVGSNNASVEFPAVEFGSEVGSLGIMYGLPREREPVEMVALDSAIPKDVERIDLLLTDTEGFDFYVADGASRFLPTRKVGMYVFELHGRERSMTAAFKRLFKAGYHCFFPVIHGAGHLPPARRASSFDLDRSVVNVTGPCWRTHYDGNTGWKNAVCIDKDDASLVELMHELQRERRPSRKCVFDPSLRESFAHLNWKPMDKLANYNSY